MVIINNVFTDDLSDLSFEGEDSLSRRRDVQCPAVLTKGLPQKGKSVSVRRRSLDFMYLWPIRSTYSAQLLKA